MQKNGYTRGGHTLYVVSIKVPPKKLAGTKYVLKTLGRQNLTLENHITEPIKA